MSKIHELRKKALEAVRDRAWDRAVKLYEHICTADAGNGSPRNELGDIYLKTGDVENAIAQFQEAARLYQEYGLTNNAVAVHKKILRHDPNHLHSLWVLGEIRLDQGLEAEASTSFMDFLARADNVPEHDRDAFVSRGLQLIEKLGDDPEILSRLDAVFASYNRGQERAQVLCAKARLAHEAGEFEVRDKYFEHARAAFRHLDALPDYVALRAIIDGVAPEEEVEADASGARSGTTVLDEQTEAFLSDFANDEIVLGTDQDSGATVELDDLDIDLGFDFDEGELSGAVERVSGSAAAPAQAEPEAGPDPLPVPEPEPEPEPEPAPEPEPMFESQPQPDPASFSEAVSEPAAGFPSEPGAQPDPQTIPADDSAPSAPSGAASDTVDLLSEILADDRFDSKSTNSRPIAALEEEMSGQIGAQLGDSQVADAYELGIVYMDMGLYEKAAASFAQAAESADDRLRAVEMQGTCLLQLDRSVDAMNVFQAGLAVPGYPGRSYLGLLYGVGVCHEVQGNSNEAIDYLERVAAVDDGFLDVVERLQRLRALIDH